MKFKVDGLEEILWWVLGWSGRAKVITPERLQDMVVEKLHPCPGNVPGLMEDRDGQPGLQFRV